jgi:uncharacterized protein
MGELRVRVQPRARRSEIAGERNGAVLVRVTAPPVGGKANEAARKLIARAVGVPPSRVAVARGAGSRDKLVTVEGVDTAVLWRALRPPR